MNNWVTKTGSWYAGRKKKSQKILQDAERNDNDIYQKLYSRKINLKHKKTTRKLSNKTTKKKKTQSKEKEKKSKLKKTLKNGKELEIYNMSDQRPGAAFASRPPRQIY